jgi:hypothetical protein
VLRADLPLIKCDVCRRVTALALEHAKQTLQKRFAHSSKRRHEFTQFDGEAEVADYIEKVYARTRARPRLRSRSMLRALKNNSLPCRPRCRR